MKNNLRSTLSKIIEKVEICIACIFFNQRYDSKCNKIANYYLF